MYKRLTRSRIRVKLASPAYLSLKIIYIIVLVIVSLLRSFRICMNLAFPGNLGLKIIYIIVYYEYVCTLCTLLCTLCTLCTLVCTLCTLVCTFCTLVCTLCTLVCTLCTLICLLEFLNCLYSFVLLYSLVQSNILFTGVQSGQPLEYTFFIICSTTKTISIIHEN